ncbi:hypothetical protein QJQ45_015994, partial [Haematococcus lacustris]
RATEAAYLEAQAQHADKILQLSNALTTAASNAVLQRTDLQKQAMEAMGEVFGPGAMQRVAGSSVGQPGSGATGASAPPGPRGAARPLPSTGEAGPASDVWGMMALEAQVEELQKEVIDMQRTIIKVQTWFKMRSTTFHGACMRQVVEARRRMIEAEPIQSEAWTQREQAEQAIELHALQLAATQADLEVAGAALARSDSALAHALATKLSLQRFKVAAQPRLAALGARLSHLTRHREAFLEWAASKQDLMRSLGESVAAADTAPRSPRPGVPSSPRALPAGRGEHAGMESGPTSDARPVQSWESERVALMQQVDELQRQLAARERAAGQPPPSPRLAQLKMPPASPSRTPTPLDSAPGSEVQVQQAGAEAAPHPGSRVGLVCQPLVSQLQTSPLLGAEAGVRARAVELMPEQVLAQLPQEQVLQHCIALQAAYQQLVTERDLTACSPGLPSSSRDSGQTRPQTAPPSPNGDARPASSPPSVTAAQGLQQAAESAQPTAGARRRSRKPSSQASEALRSHASPTLYARQAQGQGAWEGVMVGSSPAQLHRVHSALRAKADGMHTAVPASCELSALLEVVRLVEEEGVPLVTLQRGDHPCQHHDLPYINLNQDLHPPVLAPLEHLPPPPQPAVSQQCSSSSTSSRLLQGGPCHSCGVTEAPQWRRPDQGSMLLCNRCGIHYMRHRKLPGPKKEASSSGSQAARLGFGAAAAQQAMKRTASELWELGPCWSTVDISSTLACTEPRHPSRSCSGPLPAALQLVLEPAGDPLGCAQVLVLPKACVRRPPLRSGPTQRRSSHMQPGQPPAALPLGSHRSTGSVGSLPALDLAHSLCPAASHCAYSHDAAATSHLPPLPTASHSWAPRPPLAGGARSSHPSCSPDLLQLEPAQQLALCEPQAMGRQVPGGAPSSGSVVHESVGPGLDCDSLAGMMAKRRLCNGLLGFQGCSSDGSSQGSRLTLGPT